MHLWVLLVGDQPVAAVPPQRQAGQLRQRAQPQAPRRALAGVGAAVQRQLRQAAGRQVACSRADSRSKVLAPNLHQVWPNSCQQQQHATNTKLQQCALHGRAVSSGGPSQCAMCSSTHVD